MESERSEPERFVFEVDRDELTLINNALNEVCHGVSFGDDEFQARLGQAREAARALLARVHEILGPG